MASKGTLLFLPIGFSVHVKSIQFYSLVDIIFASPWVLEKTSLLQIQYPVLQFLTKALPEKTSQLHMWVRLQSTPSPWIIQHYLYLKLFHTGAILLQEFPSQLGQRRMVSSTCAIPMHTSLDSRHPRDLMH